MKGKDTCIAPHIWLKLPQSAPIITPEGDTQYIVYPPLPLEGLWMGYFVEVIFPGDTPGGTTAFPNEYIETTPGYTWPNTLPFDDCYGESCLSRTV